MRGYAMMLSSMLVLSALATGARAEQGAIQGPSREDAVAQIPMSDDLPMETVEIVEHRQPVVVAQAPLPRPRPVRVEAARPRTQAVRAAARPVEDGPRPVPVQRVALAAKPKSPLFWMSVGAGF